jgi:hypothetical protein
MSTDPVPPFSTTLFLLIALLLALAVLSQSLTKYTTAYLSAPTEIRTFEDCAEFCIKENETYGADIEKIPRREDKSRLERLLHEIQRCGDDLREELNGILDKDEGGEGGETRLSTSARLLWASKRGRLEEHVRRLDLLRMRFLVVYMGLVAAKMSGGGEARAPMGATKDPETFGHGAMPVKADRRPSLSHALSEQITKKQPPRRLVTQAMGHNNSADGNAMGGWGSVMRELQMSPKMHKRHASIEAGMMNGMTKLP